jgi:hypothetical protein
VVVDVENVDVAGTTATVRCSRTIEATTGVGAPIKTAGAAVFQLERRPTGWVITDVK